MPRPRKPDGREPKSRSRNGCWSCKARKVKCTEERPSCSKCVKGGYQCDYGIRLNWDGRRSKRPQIKAVHLDNAQLGDGDAAGGADDDDDADPDDYLGGADDDAAAHLQQSHQAAKRHPPPPRPQSHHQTQFKLDLAVSPPSSSSSTFSPVPLSSNSAQAPLNLIQFQTAVPTKVAALSRSSKPAPFTLEAGAGQFQVLTPMAMASASQSMPQFSTRRSAKAPPQGETSSQAPRPQPVADESRTPLPGGPMSAPLSLSSVTAIVAESLPPEDIGDGRPHSAKRQRIGSDFSERDFAWTWPLSPSTNSGSLSASSPRQLVQVPAFAPRPVADATSPRQSDEGQGRASPLTSGNLGHLQTGTDFRRLSVTSLLSGPFDTNSGAGTPVSSTTPPIPNSSQPTSVSRSVDGADAAQGDDHNNHSNNHHHHHHHSHNRTSRFYGIDAGFKDLDLGKNDDANALSGMRYGSKTSIDGDVEGSGGREKGGYYSQPITVRIPRALGTLPQKLTENPMNLLYFHHFINNTARVLVPHDDPQSNPFRTILPQLAINNDNLLSLLLAYSASHRARILQQTEPIMRIALWVQDIFPALRRALDDQKQKISNANVATAIMLASLAIVSPTAFGYNIPWQKHLMLARELIATRPEGLRVDHHSSMEGQVCSFLWSWFAYIDVLGGLSGGPTDASPAWILDYKVYDPQDDDEIDCIMGFTTRCVYILSQIAELVRRWEPERLRATQHDRSAWVPSMDVEMSVKSLEVDVRDSMYQTPRPCAHLHRSGDVVRWDRNEMAATNEAYHWAALVHLHRRVLGKPTRHADVQGPVRHIIACIDRVRIGGTAENCLLLPLFTAGCECLDAAQRKRLLNRVHSVEGIGMVQVIRARSLMERAWAADVPWETLLTTEFIG